MNLSDEPTEPRAVTTSSWPWRPWLLRRRLRQSLAADPTQPRGWERWLEAARSRRHLIETCPEPGWLMHVAYWREVPRDRVLRGAMALGAQLMEACPPLSAAEWALLQRRTELDVRPLIPTLLRLHRSCREMPGAPGSLDLPLGIALLIHALLIPDARDPRADEAAAPGSARLAMLYLVLAAVHAAPLFEHRAGWAEAAARAAALCAEAMPTRKPALVAALREPLGW